MSFTILKIAPKNDGDFEKIFNTKNFLLFNSFQTVYYLINSYMWFRNY